MNNRRLDDTPSFTAQVNAWQRAAESIQPLGRRLLNDPQARWFVSHPALSVTLAHPRIANFGIRLLDLYCGGLHAHIVLRRRVADELLDSSIEWGISQLVLLGAGFDTTSEHVASRDILVFEVDAPTTQRAKQEILKRRSRSLENAIWVPCDFEHDDLVRLLTAAGFDVNAPSLVVWLGVTFYLTAAALDATFDQLRRICAPASRLIVDYGDRDIVGHNSTRPTVRRVSRSVTRRGEPYRTGMTATEVDALLQRHEFETTTHLRVPELLRRYDPGNKRRLSRGDYQAICIASRKPTAP
ncbi:SAM-dependent methyltransferase [Mycobacterium sp. E3247]|uniref:class I SAM-dependent methyltransferase n=1 Tax=Mycobacterium sp. E3247 TaxID=1856864 RepID=UPI0009ECD84B|nr:SAM-dependent methyltransferase [Mycobacterium sp. E3247]